MNALFKMAAEQDFEDDAIMRMDEERALDKVEAETRAMWMMWRQGYTLREIAKEYQICYRTVHYRLDIIKKSICL